MEKKNMIKKFVEDPKNKEKLVEITNASANHVSGSILQGKYKSLENWVPENYAGSLDVVKKYLEEEGFKGVDPDKFSTDLIRYLYENRIR